MSVTNPLEEDRSGQRGCCNQKHWSELGGGSEGALVMRESRVGKKTMRMMVMTVMMMTKIMKLEMKVVMMRRMEDTRKYAAL